MKPAIVVVAYNRPRSLNRILDSIRRAQYEEENIPLVISIDHGDNREVVEAAERFSWEHGEKRIIRHTENLGLKRHVLSCGDLAWKYGSIIMLEDDLYVAKGFYNYAKQALAFTENDDKIGGVSLYNHRFNVHKRECFEAIDDGYDNWYFQFASSWGQAFTERQWEGFREWLSENDGRDVAGAAVPENVSGWGEKSWLKYCIAYLIETDRYFLYPRMSHTTNFFDEGTHSRRAQTDFQVPLGAGRKEYCFSGLRESQSVYDSFFENKRLAYAVGMKEKEVEIDLYGYRPLTKRYCLTMRSLPFDVKKSYGCMLRPLDQNIICNIPGDSFFLYDREKPAKAPKEKRGERILYFYRGFKVKYLFEIIKMRWKERKG